MADPMNSTLHCARRTYKENEPDKGKPKRKTRVLENTIGLVNRVIRLKSSSYSSDRLICVVFESDPSGHLTKEGVRMTDGNRWSLVERLLMEPRETEWLEWKLNNSNPEEIGSYISALSNSCVLHGARHGYVVWGVDDQTRQPVGTSFDFRKQRKQGQDLEHWLATQLLPRVAFTFDRFEHDGMFFVVLEIHPAMSSPTAFKGCQYIRVGSHTKELLGHPEYARRLWRAFDELPFEQAVALEQLRIENVLDLLDYPAYYSLSRTPLPENRSQIIEAMQDAGYLAYDAAFGWAITNLGGLLFGRNFGRFQSLSRKALRVITYRGSTRVSTIREQISQQGYASGFHNLIAYIMQQLPESEVISAGIRSVNSIPVSAIRELVANALIHQDFSIPGTGPMVEIFDDRIEITNPGKPLIPQERFVDHPPQSRNERLAQATRLLGISEERGSGWDKVAFEVEFSQLPAPLVEVTDSATRVVLFSARPLVKMDKDDRNRAVYLHACLSWVNRQSMTNSTVRQRFGLAENQAQMASRFIRDATAAGLIAPYDPNVGPKAMRYVPFWASSKIEA